MRLYSDSKFKSGVGKRHVSLVKHVYAHTHTQKGWDKQREYFNKAETHFTSSITCTLDLNHTKLVEDNGTLNEKAVKCSTTATLQSRLKAHCAKQQRKFSKHLQLTKHPESFIPQTFTETKHYNPHSTKC